jgi:hypothetical protein
MVPSRRLQRSGGDRRCVLADAVPCNRDHLEVLGEDAAQRALDNEQRWLRDVCRPELVVIAGKRRTQIEAGGFSRGEHLESDREIGQPLRHTGGLAALSGKAECCAGQQDRMVTR